MINQASYLPEVSSSFAAVSTCRKEKAFFSLLEKKNYLKIELLNWNQPCFQITLTIFQKVLTGQRNLIFQQTLRLQGREGEEGDITVFQERNDNQINAKLLLFKLWLLPTIVYFKTYILKFKDWSSN